MRGGFFQGIHDAVKMVFGIGLEIRIPNSLFAEDDFSVDNGGGFSVAAAEIEADAAAIEMASECGGGVSFSGELARMNDFKRMIEHTFGDDVRVKFASRCVAIVRRKFVCERRRTLK